MIVYDTEIEESAGMVSTMAVSLVFPLLSNDDDDWPIDRLGEHIFATMLLLNTCSNSNKNRQCFKCKKSILRRTDNFQGLPEQQSSAMHL